MNDSVESKGPGFGTLNFLAPILVVAVFAMVVLPELAKTKCTCMKPSCVNNEKQLGIAFRGFGIDLGTSPMRLKDGPVAPTETEPLREIKAPRQTISATSQN